MEVKKKQEADELIGFMNKNYEKLLRAHGWKIKTAIWLIVNDSVQFSSITHNLNNQIFNRNLQKHTSVKQYPHTLLKLCHFPLIKQK